MLVNTHKLRIKALIISSLFITTLSAQVWTLEQCIDTALLKNKTLQMSRTNIALGEQRQKEATAGLIPKVMINGVQFRIVLIHELWSGEIIFKMSAKV